MIVPDLKLLLYAHNQGSTRHSAARHWWANLLQGDETVGIPRYLQIPGSGPNIVTDAHIAALAFEHDATVHTADTDFSRFPGLIWTNPLPAL